MSRWSHQRKLFGGLYTYLHNTAFSHTIFGTHLWNGRSLCFINSCMFLCISLWFIRCGSIQLDLFSQLGCKFERQNLSSIKPWHIFELVSVENSWSQLDIEQNMLRFPSTEASLCITGTNEDRFAEIWIVKLGMWRRKSCAGDCPCFLSFTKTLISDLRNVWCTPGIVQGAACNWVPQMFMKCVICKSNRQFPVGLAHMAKYNLRR